MTIKSHLEYKIYVNNFVYTAILRIKTFDWENIVIEVSKFILNSRYIKYHSVTIWIPWKFAS